MVYVIVAIAFVVVFAGSAVVGRWFIRKGRDLERGPKDA
jgi:hypothetical protein